MLAPGIFEISARVKAISHISDANAASGCPANENITPAARARAAVHRDFETRNDTSMSSAKRFASNSTR